MSIESILFVFLLGTSLVSMILYVVFGQITVRKLRKNPKTKHELGIEFMSGWDILNVAGALAMPRWLNRKLQSTPLAFLYASAEILDQNTNVFDRVLAVIFYGLFIFSGLSIILWAILGFFGIFD